MNARDKDGQTALVKATVKGYDKSICKLINAGADIYLADNTGETAFSTSARNGWISSLNILINFAQKLEGTLSPVCTEETNSYTKMSQSLIMKQKQRKLKAISIALLAAIEGKHKGIATLLVDIGADVNYTRNSGTTPLIMATCSQYVKGVKLLLDKGANVNKTDNRGYTALLYAAQSGNAYLVEVLLKSGSDPNKGNTSGITPVQAAVENSFNKCLELLILSGGDINIKSIQSEPLLILAAQNGNHEVIHYLLNAGADPNMTDCLGNTALIAAAGCSAIPIYNLILKSGVHTYLLDQVKTFKSDPSALEKMQLNSVQCLQLILKSGIFINQRNKFGENALDYYLLNFESHSQDIILLLFAAGEVSNINLQEYTETRKIDVPHIMKPSLNCKHLCRNAIRKHLLYLNPHLPLFNIIQNLRLPSVIKAYLLFDTTLDLV